MLSCAAVCGAEWSATELEEFAQNYSYDPHGRHVNEKGGLEWINAVLSGKHSEENVVLESMPTETVRSLRYVRLHFSAYP